MTASGRRGNDRLAAASVVVAALAIAITRFLREDSAPAAAVKPGTGATPPAEIDRPESDHPDAARQRSETEPAPSPRAALLPPPTDQQIRDEAIQDLEAPSAALVRYSVELERKYQAALPSEKDSARLLDEMSACVGTEAGSQGGNSATESARALCLGVASRIAERHPPLRPRYTRIEESASPRVLQIKRVMDQSI